MARGPGRWYASFLTMALDLLAALNQLLSLEHWLDEQ